MQLGTVYACASRLAPGAQPISGFRLRDRLSLGSAGEVWSAEAPGGYYVALKFLRLAREPGEAEFRALGALWSLRHPNLLPSFGIWQVDDLLVLGRELADQSLWDRYGEAIEEGRPGIPREELLEALAGVARALDYVNRPRPGSDEGSPVGGPHGAVRPPNLLRVGGGVKVADYGLGQLAALGLIRRDLGARAWTYAAPEALRKQPSPWSDQYSLAVSYCHLRGGRLPFAGPPEAIRAGHLLDPPDLSMLPEPERPAVARALAKEPDQRWPSCRAFIDALTVSASASSSRAVSVPVALPEPMRSELLAIDPPTSDGQAKPRRWRPVLAACLGLVAAGAGLWAAGPFSARPPLASPRFGSTPAATASRQPSETPIRHRVLRPIPPTDPAPVSTSTRPPSSTRESL
ncbi:MAG: hypothetical protein IRY99_23705 [Isosphaeraceae bacterium]|nr:hypothetical protein [Isosphaeraceae bacterium]